MIRDNLPRLQPVSTAGPQGEAALLVDEAASPEALFLEADSRLTAAQGMLFTVALAGDHRDLDGQDVQNSDALDLMRALHGAHSRASLRQDRHPHTRHQEA